MRPAFSPERSWLSAHRAGVAVAEESDVVSRPLLTAFGDVFLMRLPSGINMVHDRTRGGGSITTTRPVGFRQVASRTSMASCGTYVPIEGVRKMLL